MLPRLMTVVSFEHFDKNKKCIYKQENIGNIWHKEGQEFVLSLAFDTDAGFSVPANYYIGLDNRPTLSADDTLLDLDSEPDGAGYNRYAFSSEDGFAIGESDGIIKAASGIATFSATTDQFGPIANIFLATSATSSGILIASAPLNGSRVVLPGESISAKVELTLGRCA